MLPSSPPSPQRPPQSGAHRWNPVRSLPARILWTVLGAVLATAVGTTVAFAGPLSEGWSLGRILILDTLVAVVFGALGLRIGRSIVHPIETLTSAARRISQGENPLEISESHAADEIALLTQSFRDMTQRLADNHLELQTSQNQVVEANAQLTSQNDRLHQANEILEQLSITDGLTRLHNHRFFQDTLIREAKRADRTGEPLALILADIDHFKQWNDRLGHAGGDEILRRVSRVMNTQVRETDLLARYGGEEFAILLPNTPMEGAVALAQKIRSTVSETAVLLTPPSEQQPVTISLGVAAYAGDRKKLFNDADQALYLAKDSGRDCVMAADFESLI